MFALRLIGIVLIALSSVALAEQTVVANDQIKLSDAITLLTAIASLLVSFLAFKASKRAGEKARTADTLSVLHQIWSNVYDPFHDPENPNVDDAIDCVNALNNNQDTHSS